VGQDAAGRWTGFARLDAGPCRVAVTTSADYENGHGVEKNIEESKKWYRRASEQGLKEAQEALKKLE